MYCEALALSLGKLWIFWLEGITTDADTEGKKRYTHTKSIRKTSLIHYTNVY